MAELSNNRKLGNRATQFVSVKDFGAVGDGVTDDTAAIEAAIASVSSGGFVTFPDAGVYIVSNALAVPSRVTLDLMGGSIIEQSTDGVPIIDFTSASSVASRMQVINGRIRYANQQTVVGGSAVLIADGTTTTSNWLLQNLAISKAYHSTYIPDGANTFLGQMRNVTSVDSDFYAYQFGGGASVHTNIVFENVWAYQTPGSERPNGRGFNFQNIQELMAHSIAVDNAQGIPVRISTCGGVINNIAIESCDRSVSSALGYHVGVILSEVEIGNVFVTGNNVTLSGTGSFSVTYTNSGSSLRLGNVTDNDTTLTNTGTGDYYAAYSENTGDRIWNHVALSRGTSPDIAIGEASPGDQSRFRMWNGIERPYVTTTASLEDISDAVNTQDKFEGRVLYNTTTNAWVSASGSLASNVWRDLTGTTQHTPV